MHHSDVMAIDVKANPTTGTTRSPAQNIRHEERNLCFNLEKCRYFTASHIKYTWCFEKKEKRECRLQARAVRFDYLSL